MTIQLMRSLSLTQNVRRVHAVHVRKSTATYANSNCTWLALLARNPVPATRGRTKSALRCTFCGVGTSAMAVPNGISGGVQEWASLSGGDVPGEFSFF